MRRGKSPRGRVQRTPLAVRITALAAAAWAVAAECSAETCTAGAQIVPTPRFPDLSVAEFEATYLGKTPVVTRHPVPFGLDDMVRECPNIKLPVQRMASNGGKVPVTPDRKLKKLVENWKKGKKQSYYVGEADFTCNCPNLLFENYTMPYMYARDELWTDVAVITPVIFLGPAGTGTSWHIDASGLPFFVHMLEGRKRWRTITVEDAEAHILGADERVDSRQFRTKILTEDESQNIQQFGHKAHDLDLFNDTEVAEQLSSKVTVWDTTLEPGDVLYVPPWGLHAALNVAGTALMLSANYADQPHAVRMLPRYGQADFCASGNTDFTESESCERLQAQIRRISRGAPSPAEAVQPGRWVAPNGLPWCFTKLLTCHTNEHAQRDILKHCHASGVVDLPDAEFSTLFKAPYVELLGPSFKGVLAKAAKTLGLTDVHPALGAPPG